MCHCKILETTVQSLADIALPGIPMPELSFPGEPPITEVAELPLPDESVIAEIDVLARRAEVEALALGDLDPRFSAVLADVLERLDTGED